MPQRLRFHRCEAARNPVMSDWVALEGHDVVDGQAVFFDSKMRTLLTARN
jgi:hypothetical protein